MNLQNGYKVIYEKAADGKRTFYASKTGICDPTVDTQLGETFVDAEYAGKTIYEYKGSFYISAGKTPAYDENGVPTDERLSAFDEVFVKAEPSTEPEEDTEKETDKNPEEDGTKNDGTDLPGGTIEDPVVEDGEF